MIIHLRYFASLRERLKTSAATREVPAGSSAGAVWSALCADHPELEPMSASVSFAVNREYVGREHVLADGDELALIPPVSGGAPVDDPLFRIVSDPIDAAAVTAAVADPATGATCTFIGTTRDHNDGRQVTTLEYEAYPEMALAEMRKIGDEARRRWPVAKVAIVHRIGVVPIGEASVVIAVSSAHRVAAFDACHFAIDRLKEVVPIWKKEHFDGGEVWIGSQTGKRYTGGKPG
ncbi:MAG: molybdopterin converting factor subunit 1 [Deltaproteobacteria bacterium]|nr:molybdopterin converting factor subunit 1 [Deltaproteobacteria bacterium]